MKYLSEKEKNNEKTNEDIAKELHDFFQSLIDGEFADDEDCDEDLED